jgi:dATP pyrophosphohydrolase
MNVRQPLEVVVFPFRVTAPGPAKHHFVMDVTREPAPVVLSHERSEFRWVPYGEASATLRRYDDDKTALWELDARIRAGDLPAALS